MIKKIPEIKIQNSKAQLHQGQRCCDYALIYFPEIHPYMADNVYSGRYDDPIPETLETLGLTHDTSGITPSSEKKLVAYFNQLGNLEKDTLKHATHWAVLFEDGTLKSKWGLLSTFEHPLNIVPATYGQYFTVFRRNKA